MYLSTKEVIPSEKIVEQSSDHTNKSSESIPTLFCDNYKKSHTQNAKKEVWLLNHCANLNQWIKMNRYPRRMVLYAFDSNSILKSVSPSAHMTNINSTKYIKQTTHLSQQQELILLSREFGNNNETRLHQWLKDNDQTKKKLQLHWDFLRK